MQVLKFFCKAQALVCDHFPADGSVITLDRSEKRSSDYICCHYTDQDGVNEKKGVNNKENNSPVANTIPQTVAKLFSYIKRENISFSRRKVGKMVVE
ncbi:unnamed protein product [Eruca vesicaria subsp. sativa]|uniref:Uncharacterized protein n=1 Tax=Eruca vesicaria subsp. sativa TaxID=29727 RepID=A0ABC8LJS1_ERUVS|nr:unnamed protein product [Eruca vesicaria subsp. sativa]